VIKPAAEFHCHAYTTRAGRKSVRLNSGCRVCHLERCKRRDPVKRSISGKEYWRANRVKIREKNRAYRLKRPDVQFYATLKYSYGITRERYDTLVLEQGNRCKVCREQPRQVGKKARLHVDHDHETGAIRGLLCHNCNVSIGLLKDDVGRVRALLEYLERNGQVSGDVHLGRGAALNEGS
jgi:hypothetical protein